MPSIHTEHQLLQEKVATLLKNYGFRVQLEAKLNGIRADILAVDPDSGRRLLIECKMAEQNLSNVIIEHAKRYLKFLNLGDEFIVITSGIPNQRLQMAANRAGIRVWDIAKLKNELSFIRKPYRIGRWSGTLPQLATFCLVFILYWGVLVYIQNFRNSALLSLLVTFVFIFSLVASGLLKEAYLNLRKFEASAKK